jgi:integrase
MPRLAQPWFRSFDGWWYVKINGKPVKLVRGKDNGPAARARWHELMAEQLNNPPLESQNHTVASIIDLYLNYAQPLYTKATYEVRLHYLQGFAEAHGFRRVQDCKPIHLTTWMSQHPEWASDWTRNSVARIVQRPFNWAARQGLIVANPFRGVSHQAGEPRRPMTDQEFEALLQAADYPSQKREQGNLPAKPSRSAQRFRRVLLFLRYTGARPGEMARLIWEDLDLDSAVIVLRRHKTSRTQRQPRPRIIPLVPEVVQILVEIKQEQPPGTKHVFLNSRGNPWNRCNLSLLMQRLRKRAGLPKEVKLYGLRHQFGTQAIMNGVDIKTLAELMGHTSTRMTEHYLHLAGQRAHLASAMQKAVSGRSIS